MRSSERTVVLLLALTSLASIGFIASYVVSSNTQLLGLTLGLAFCFLAAASIVTGKRIVDQRKSVEWRSPPREEAAIEAEGEPLPGEEPVSRRTLLIAATGALGAVGAALVVPLASLGPKVGDTIVDTPWFRGRRLVDDEGKPISIDSIAVGSFLPAFPEGADKRALGSSIVVVSIDPTELDLPPDRADWAPQGVLAFSRICTHAGCAIALFRYPRYPPTAPGPALVCPCHYSTFDVLTGGKRIFGPAGRSLPQLPLAVDAQRHLIAGGELSAPPGPSYLSVRRA